MSICHATSPSVIPSVCQSTCSSVTLSVHDTASLPVIPDMSVCCTTSLSMIPSVCQLTHSSVALSVHETASLYIIPNMSVCHVTSPSTDESVRPSITTRLSVQQPNQSVSMSVTVQPSDCHYNSSDHMSVIHHDSTYTRFKSIPICHEWEQSHKAKKFCRAFTDTIPTRNGRELGEIWVSKVGTNF